MLSCDPTGWEHVGTRRITSTFPAAAPDHLTALPSAARRPNKLDGCLIDEADESEASGQACGDIHFQLHLGTNWDRTGERTWTPHRFRYKEVSLLPEMMEESEVSTRVTVPKLLKNSLTSDVFPYHIITCH
jgi:hypothetical protein